MKLLRMPELKKHLMNEFRKIPEGENVKFDIEFEKPRFDSQPYIINKGNSYHLLCYERGQLIQNYATTDLAEFTFKVFRDITYRAALSYAKKKDIKYQDTRRLLFSQWMELLGYIDIKYKEKCTIEIEEILREHPYADSNKLMFDIIDDIDSLLNKLIAMDVIEDINNHKDIKSILDVIQEFHKSGTKDLYKFYLTLINKLNIIIGFLANNYNDERIKFIVSAFNRIIEQAKKI